MEPREVNILQRKAEEFLQIFRKGEEFTQELLRENERLRFRVAQLEEAEVASRRTDELAFKNLRERLALLEEERDRLLARFKEVEEENKVFASKYLEVELENNNLANLYVASYQLHSTLDFEEVLRVVQEIVINLVGAEKFVLYLRNERTDELAPAAAEGLNMADVSPVLVGERNRGAGRRDGRELLPGIYPGLPGDRLRQAAHGHPAQDQRPRHRCPGGLQAPGAEAGVFADRLRAFLDAGRPRGDGDIQLEALFAVGSEALNDPGIPRSPAGTPGE